MPRTYYPKGPRVAVAVTDEIITTAIVGDSSHCMIAEAIAAAVPTARKISVDIATCRFTDPARGLRYVYLTPAAAQNAIIEFDEGHQPDAFTIILRDPHVSNAGHKRSPEQAAKHAAASRTRRELNKRYTPVPDRAVIVTEPGNKVPRIVGGKRAPQFHRRRVFGLKGFRARSAAAAAANAAGAATASADASTEA